MLDKIPFEVPMRLLARFEAGELVRYGTILKDVTTGKIAGHLQETGIAQELLSSVMSRVPTPLSLAADFLNVGTNLYSARKIQQLKALMDTLQVLQVATLGVSLVGVGVSVAGFVYMHKRFNKLDLRIAEVFEAVQRGFEEQRKSELRAHLAKTRSLVDRAQHARHLNSPLAEYMNVAAELADQAAFFEGEIAYLCTLKGPVDRPMFWQLVQALMLCNSLRIDCEIRTNELGHAFVVTESVASSYQNLFQPLTPISFNCSVEEGLTTVKVLRDATYAAASKPFLIDHLRVARIQGDDYLTALEQEVESPLLFLRQD